MYNKTIQQKFKAFFGREDLTILGIETSCDETAAAVTVGTRVLSSVIASQAAIHQRFGGVVPEVASRNHTLDILGVIDSALNQAQKTLDDIDAIAVVYCPGLIGSLLIGVATAKALSLAKNIPLVGVNHIEAHICACYANEKDLKPPFLAVVASGGHTSIIDVAGYNSYTKIAGTLDDAIGEAFDKVARILGLEYPGGPNVDRLAKEGIANIKFTKPKGVSADLSLSYSGLKTAVINYVNRLKQRGEEIPVADICASFNKEAADILVATVLKAAKNQGRDTIILAGGVAANSYLRDKLIADAGEECRVVIPPIELCGDNAVMVAIRGFFAAREGADLAGLDLNAQSVV